MAKEYVLKSPEELLLLWSERRAKEGDNVAKLLAFFLRPEAGARDSGPGDWREEAVGLRPGWRGRKGWLRVRQQPTRRERREQNLDLHRG